MKASTATILGVAARCVAASYAWEWIAVTHYAMPSITAFEVWLLHFLKSAIVPDYDLAKPDQDAQFRLAVYVWFHALLIVPFAMAASLYLGPVS